MTKHVHIHVHRAPTRDEEEGRWVTINGAHVFVGKGGEIKKGPAALVGKSATGAHLDAVQHHKEKAATKGEKHGDFGHHLNAMHSHTGAAIHANKPAGEDYGRHAAAAAEHESKIGGIKAMAHRDASQTAMAHAKAAASTKEAEMLKRKSQIHAALAEDPDDERLRGELNKLNSDIGVERGKAQMGQVPADLDKARAQQQKGVANAAPDDPKHAAAAKHGLTYHGQFNGKDVYKDKNGDYQKLPGTVPIVQSMKPMPKAHQKLHAEAEAHLAKVGGEQHKKAHADLMKRYNEADADWKRTTINRQIERNMVVAGQDFAAAKEKKAREMSAAAHASGKPEDHRAAAEHLDAAHSFVGKYGGAGYAAKQTELSDMRQKHESLADKPKK